MSHRTLFIAALALLLGGCSFHDHPAEPAYGRYACGGHGVPCHLDRGYAGLFVGHLYAQGYDRASPPRPLYGPSRSNDGRLYQYNGGSAGDRAYPNRFDYTPHLSPPAAPPPPAYRPPMQGTPPGGSLYNGHPPPPLRPYGGSTPHSPGGYRR